MTRSHCTWIQFRQHSGPTCYGCQWKCNCTNKRNILCHRAISSSCADNVFRNDLYAEPPRSKYVCLSCCHIWKTKYSRYMDIDNTNSRQRKPACCKCGRPGILAGRNFRHCKNSKEWKKLIQEVANGSVNLYGDFDFAITKTDSF